LTCQSLLKDIQLIFNFGSTDDASRIEDHPLLTMIEDIIMSVREARAIDHVAVVVVTTVALLILQQRFVGLVQKAIQKHCMSRLNSLTREPRRSKGIKCSKGTKGAPLWRGGMVYDGPLKVNNQCFGLVAYFFYYNYQYYKSRTNSISLLISSAQFCFALYAVFNYGPSGVAADDGWLYDILFSSQSLVFLTAFSTYKTFKQSRLAAQITKNDSSIAVGDVINLCKGNIVPADCIFITMPADESHQSAPQDIPQGSTALMDEVELNGNPNRVVKRSVSQDRYSTIAPSESCVLFAGTKIVSIIAPTRPLSDGTDIELCIQALVWKVGKECKIVPLSERERRPSAISESIALLAKFNLWQLFVVAGFASLAIPSNMELFRYYVAWLLLFFNPLIPLSLEFCHDYAAEVLGAEITQVCKVEVTPKGAAVVTHSTPDILIHDKTGTLTTNNAKLLNIMYTEPIGLSGRAMTFDLSVRQEKLEDIMNSMMAGSSMPKWLINCMMACNQTVVVGEKAEMVDILDFTLLRDISLLGQHLRLTRNDFGADRIVGTSGPSNSSWDDHVEWSDLKTGQDYKLSRLLFKEFDDNLCLKYTLVHGVPADSNEGSRDGHGSQYALCVQGKIEKIQALCKSTSPSSMYPAAIAGMIKLAESVVCTPGSILKMIGFGYKPLTIEEVRQMLIFHSVSDAVTRQAKDSKESEWQTVQEATLNQMLSGLTAMGVYVFEDELRPNVALGMKELTDMGISNVICTGDSFKAAEDLIRELKLNQSIQSAMAVNFTCLQQLDALCFSPGQTISDMLKRQLLASPLYINGEVLDQFLSPKYVDRFRRLLRLYLEANMIICCYRATPLSKQQLTGFLKTVAYSTTVKGGTVGVVISPVVGMVGDGANDCGAIQESDIGYSCNGEGETKDRVIDQACDVKLKEWYRLISVIKHAKMASVKSSVVCRLALLVHSLKSYSNLAIFLFSGFAQIESYIAQLLLQLTTFLLVKKMLDCPLNQIHQWNSASAVSAMSFFRGAVVTFIDVFLVVVFTKDSRHMGNIILPILVSRLTLEVVETMRTARYKSSPSSKKLEQMLEVAWICWTIWFFYQISTGETDGSVERIIYSIIKCFCLKVTLNLVGSLALESSSLV
jgi:magnesium-transporting ATPase (P-type)